jgi:uncharacterized protein (TIGR00369 family)
VRKIINPFAPAIDKPYTCFCCSPRNSIGLNLSFWEDSDEVFTMWNPSDNYDGFPGILHGGLQATVMDEVAAWTVYVKCGTSGVTVNLNVNYKLPAFTGKGALKIVATVIESNKRLARLATKVINSDGTVASEAVITYFLYPYLKAVSDHNYPGLDAFFETVKSE